MLQFHSLSPADKARIDEFVRAEDSRSADFFFGNMLLWDEEYRQQVADFDQGRLITMCCTPPHPIFPFPIGTGPLAPAIEAILEYADAQGFPPVLCGLERRHMEALEACFPGRFEFTPDRDYFDYIYEAERLCTLSGKALHGKRNHIHRFTQEHDWRCVPLTAELFPVCRMLMEQWADSAGRDDADVRYERLALERAFAHYDTLDLMGAVLFAEDAPAAFTIGEIISSDTVDIHFEKARADMEGAYPMINREFVRMVCAAHPEIRYVNREDDMGLENLRKSKESYHPAILLEKFTAERKCSP